MNSRYNIQNNTTKTSIYFKPTESNNLDGIKSLLDYDDKNIEEDVNEMSSYEKVSEYIYRLIKHSGFLCKGLNIDYIVDSFYKVDALVVIGSTMQILPNGNIYGFALIEFDQENNSIYIDVICSHIGIQGAGDILIKEIEVICRKILMENIYLTSVKSAIPFYEKYGFVKHVDSCNDMCVMIKSFDKKKGGKQNKKETKKKQQRKTNKKQTKKRNKREKRKMIIKTRKNYFT